jgi:enoyl-CoA hydratase
MVLSLIESREVECTVEEGIVYFKISRKEQLNALDHNVLTAIEKALFHIQNHKDLYTKFRVAVILGDGDKAFAAGADIRFMSTLGEPALLDFIELGQRVVRSIERFPLPIIAAVKGFALGGGLEIALGCDLIVANTSAKLGLPEVKIGLFPGFGGTQRLIDRVGLSKAKKIIYTGRAFTSQEAHELGFVDDIYSDDVFDAKLKELCLEIASNAPLAVAKAKIALNARHGSSLLTGLRHEVENFRGILTNDDKAEGFNSFLQKRKPEFKGY